MKLITSTISKESDYNSMFQNCDIGSTFLICDNEGDQCVVMVIANEGCLKERKYVTIASSSIEYMPGDMWRNLADLVEHCKLYRCIVTLLENPELHTNV